MTYPECCPNNAARLNASVDEIESMIAGKKEQK